MNNKYSTEEQETWLSKAVEANDEMTLPELIMWICIVGGILGSLVALFLLGYGEI